MIMYYQTKFAYKMFVDLESIWTNIDILALCCDLDLDCSNPIFSTEDWLMMLHDHTKHKMFCVSEDINQTNIR